MHPAALEAVCGENCGITSTVVQINSVTAQQCVWISFTLILRDITRAADSCQQRELRLRVTVALCAAAKHIC